MLWGISLIPAEAGTSARMPGPKFRQIPTCVGKSGSKESLRQVPPIWIGLLNHTDLPIAPPFLDLTLFGKRGLAALKHIKPHQLVAIIARRKPFEEPCSMFIGALVDVIRHAGIEHAMRLVGHDVDVKHALPPYPLIPAKAGTSTHMPRPSLADPDFRRDERSSITPPSFRSSR